MNYFKWLICWWYKQHIFIYFRGKEGNVFDVQRELFTWKTYGKTGMEEPKIVPLNDLTSDHIEAIIDTQMHIKGTWVEELMKKELEYRKSV